MLPRFGDPDIFPSFGSVSRRLLSLHRVPRDGSPASSVLWSLSDFPPPVWPSSVAFAGPYRLCAPSFRSCSWGASPAASPDLWSAGTLTGNDFGGDGGISQVPGGAPVDVCRA